MKILKIDYLIFNFNEFDSVNTNGSINIDQFNTIAKEKHEQDAILYEAQDIPKIKEDFVFKISKILMEQHILRTQKEKEEMIEKSYRSEEHTSELQSRFDLVCRLLLEKKNITKQKDK